MNFKNLVFVLFIYVGLIGCTTQPRSPEDSGSTNQPNSGIDDSRPDLRPEVDPGRVMDPGSSAIIGIVSRNPERNAPNDFCIEDSDGLVLRFQNSGGLSSSTIPGTVTFQTRNNNEEVVNFTIPEISAKENGVNGVEEVSVRIPSGCFNPDCDFTIKWSNQPAVGGICIG